MRLHAELPYVVRGCIAQAWSVVIFLPCFAKTDVLEEGRTDQAGQKFLDWAMLVMESMQC